STGFARAGDWPTWRGPAGNGVSDEKETPTSWSATENIVWKSPLPGGGNSTPIVWGDSVFVTCASKQGAIRSVICFARSTGNQQWSADTEFAGVEPTHADNPYCASSPITDGKAVYAWLGSAGVVAYDFSGRLLWKTDLGPFKHIWGNATSPVFYKDTLILKCGPGTNCFLVALNKETGKPTWKRELPDAVGKVEEFKGSWSSPVLCQIGETLELIAALPGYVAAFDPETGEELWRCRGLGALSYADPLVGKETIVAMSGYGGPAIAMRTPKPADRGDLTESHRLWVVTNNPQRIGSGIMIGNRVYILNEPGIAECLDALTGKTIWKGRAAGSTWGSTILADGKFFTTDQSGETTVWSPGDELKILTHNPLNEKVRATPVFSDGQIFIRTYANLYCIGKRK
ncbi:MAG: Serine/threonine protein kinase, partial [Phycisphaerales bacterium]|nr:Serine/threonine protein kinase [Phycisphaerales bacterium]